LALSALALLTTSVHSASDWKDDADKNTDPTLKVLLPQSFSLPRKGAVDVRGDMTTEVLRVGPFEVQGSSEMEGNNVILTRPFPDATLEVAHFGSFVPTFLNGTEVPRALFYLHHILAYDSISGDFVTGVSNERMNWGPDHLPYPYRQILAPGALVRANGFHMNALTPLTIQFYINYTITYKVHVPTDPEIRVVRSFYWLDNYNVPGGGERNSTMVRSRNNAIPWDMVIVMMNGHLHQGGKRIVAEFQDTSRQPHTLCASYGLYKSDYPCFWDCGAICPYKNDWPAHWSTTTCYMELPVRAGEKVLSFADYDNSCTWRGVMAWWFNFGWGGKTLGMANGEVAKLDDAPKPAAMQMLQEMIDESERRRK